jgi:hypothetical protein
MIIKSTLKPIPYFLLFLFLLFSFIDSHAQSDSSHVKQTAKDSTTRGYMSELFGSHRSKGKIDSSLIRHVAISTDAKNNLTMDAIYDRPFFQAGKFPVTVGGYVEADWQHIGSDGISAGNQFQFRRFSLFVAASITKRIKFLSEIEVEDDPSGDADAVGKGLVFGLEYAAIDIELHPLLNLRGGIVLTPLGGFNQNHDGPKWEFTDRPLAMSQLLPETFSAPGFGIYGKQYTHDWMFGYEFYLTGGLNDSIIDNPQGHTYLPAALGDPNRFTSSASGYPCITGKLSLKNKYLGELGLSYMGNIYNTWAEEGLVVDKKRWVHVADVNYNVTLPVLKTFFTTEWAMIFVDVPTTYTQQYGSKQLGGFADFVQPVYRHKILGWNNATFNIAFRAEYVHYNIGHFPQTGGKIYDDIWSIMPGISFRPSAQTVIRVNYRYEKTRDILGNPAIPFSTTAGISVGISTYF